MGNADLMTTKKGGPEIRTAFFDIDQGRSVNRRSDESEVSIHFSNAA